MIFVKFFLTHIESCVEILKYVLNGLNIRLLVLDEHLDYVPELVINYLKQEFKTLARDKERFLNHVIAYLDSIIQNIYLDAEKQWERISYKWFVSHVTKLTYGVWIDDEKLRELYNHMITSLELGNVNEVDVLDIDIDVVKDFHPYVFHVTGFTDVKDVEHFKKVHAMYLKELGVKNVEYVIDDNYIRIIEQLEELDTITIDELFYIINKVRPKIIHFSNIRKDVMNQFIDYVQNLFKKRGLKTKVIGIYSEPYILEKMFTKLGLLKTKT